jgi:hypothetical protein
MKPKTYKTTVGNPCNFCNWYFQSVHGGFIPSWPFFLMRFHLNGHMKTWEQTLEFKISASSTRSCTPWGKSLCLVYLICPCTLANETGYGNYKCIIPILHARCHQDTRTFLDQSWHPSWLHNWIFFIGNRIHRNKVMKLSLVLFQHHSMNIYGEMEV